jgi:fructose-bisphosphate aldolase, class II
MTLATLADVLQPALAGGYAVPGLVCLGWEDTRAYVQAAQAEGAPVILQAGPSCRAHTPLPVLGAMFRCLAADVDVPVVAHLDHGTTLDECRAALDAGFTSLMFDGARLPLRDNIDLTRQVADMAHTAGMSCEGEIGFVGYAGGQASIGTDPAAAAIFARETAVDAMAIAIGNVHLQQNSDATLDLARLRAIEAGTTVPLVLHGGSGIALQDRRALATGSRVCKFNFGTELRMVFGAALRQALAADPGRFDRIAILADTHLPVFNAARQVIRSVNATGKARPANATP